MSFLHLHECDGLSSLFLGEINRLRGSVTFQFNHRDIFKLRLFSFFGNGHLFSGILLIMFLSLATFKWKMHS